MFVNGTSWGKQHGIKYSLYNRPLHFAISVYNQGESFEMMDA